MSSRKDIKKLVRDLERQGWRVVLGKSGHYKAYSPDGVTIVSFASTPSDHRAMENILARLRKGGYNP